MKPFDAEPGLPLSDVVQNSERRRFCALIDRSDIQMALKAGFKMDEIRYMLDLPEEPSPTADV